MKKVLSFLIAFCLAVSFVPAAFAEWDLSGMSFDELVALKDQINLAIWNSAEWQEVTVPQGVWQVGADIPAGKWTIKPLQGASTSVETGTSVSEDGTSIPFGSMISIKTIVSTAHKRFDASKHVSEWSVDLHDGEYVKIDDGPAIFTPYVGKPSLGFK